MDQLMTDLFRAYYDARKNKRNTVNQLKFELKLEENLFALHHELSTRTYTILPSIAFIVFRPVQREIFAADFRDRVIHHLVVNYLDPIYEPRLLANSCSCRKGKGTTFGVDLCKRYMRACSDNYSRNCYIMKLDIKGYFMTMNRQRLYDKIDELIGKGERKAAENGTPPPFDAGLLRYLLHLIIFNDPRTNCIVKGTRKDWEGLPPSKSLFHSPEGCGFPIGNLTSQVFSNIYLHDLDSFIVHKLGLKYYVRYVDDFMIIHEDKQLLIDLVGVLKHFLKENMGLDLHPNKIYIQHYAKGVQFLNAYIKPYRTYIRNRTKSQAYQTLRPWNEYFDTLPEGETPPREKLEEFRAQINSYLGFMIHQKTYKLRRKILLEYLSPKAYRYFYAVNLRKMVLKKSALKG